MKILTHQPRFIKALGVAAVSGAAVFLLAAGALVCSGLRDDIHVADLGVVPGNTVYPDGTPSPRLAARLDRAVELHQQGMIPLILVSGATGKEGRDEAVAMRGYLLGHGVPAADVLLDSRGNNTFATAINTRTLMHERGLHSALVISQYFHVPRARLALQRCGVEHVYAAHARYFEWRDLYAVPREVIGIIRYAIRSYD